MGRRDFVLLRVSDQRTRAHETTKSGPRNDVTNHYAHSSVTWLLLKCADFKEAAEEGGGGLLKNCSEIG
ncbi:unnamed protein product, partial [Musa banksii]